MRTFKTKAFARFAHREGIGDRALCDAVARIAKGLVDADLGGGVFKQRIARKGGGRSGGFRTIVLFRKGDLAFLSTGSPRATGRTFAGTSWRPIEGWPTGIWRWGPRASRRRRRLER